MSTVKDSLANVRAFVTRNAAAGVDHMFVFLDGETPEVRDYLDGLPHVTAIRTGKHYWRGTRPSSLNSRQVINANLVNAVLSGSEEVAWLFHIDGDEGVDIDRELLLGLDPSVRTVRLTGWEAVSRMRWTGPVDRFKRPLTDDELALLKVLGVIPRARMGDYFRGYTGGKPGVRPTLDLRLRIHGVQDQDQQVVDPFVSETLRVLHYDSVSGEEFLRKWSSASSRGSGTHFVGNRDTLRRAVAAVLDNPTLSDSRKREVLLQVYERAVQDDVETLEGLGLLTSPTVRPPHRPAGLPPREVGVVNALLERLRAVDKDHFRIAGEVPHPAALLDDLRREPGLDQEMSAWLDRALARSKTRPAQVSRR